MNRSIIHGALGAAALLCLAPAAGAHVTPGHTEASATASTTAGHTTPAPARFQAGAITVEAPWSRATPGGARVAGGYLKVTNSGPTADRLIGGTFSASGRFELHEMSVVEGTMRMRPLASGIEIPAGQTVELTPGGLHAMFPQLHRQLKEGERVKGTLIFEHAGTIEVEYQVRGMGAQAPAGDDHGHHP